MRHLSQDEISTSHVEDCVLQGFGSPLNNKSLAFGHHMTLVPSIANLDAGNMLMLLVSSLHTCSRHRAGTHQVRNLQRDAVCYFPQHHV